MSAYFTSDTHFGHRRVIEYCDRPFARAAGGGPLARPSEIGAEFEPDIEAMDEELVRRWCEVVRPEDVVFHLGDFALGPELARRVAEIRRRLTGRVELILGNHDRSREFYLRAGFDAVYRTASVSVPLLSGESVRVELAHHPVLAPAGVALCGHVHEKWRRRGSVVNVGVDQWDFRPVSIDELLACPEG